MNNLISIQKDNQTGINSDINLNNPVKQLTLAESFAKTRLELFRNYEVKVDFNKSAVNLFQNTQRTVTFGSNRKNVSEQKPQQRINTIKTRGMKWNIAKKKKKKKRKAQVEKKNCFLGKIKEETKVCTFINNMNDDKCKNSPALILPKSNEEKTINPENSVSFLNDVATSDPFAAKNIKVTVNVSQKAFTEKKVYLKDKCYPEHFSEPKFGSDNVIFNSNETSHMKGNCVEENKSQMTQELSGNSVFDSIKEKICSVKVAGCSLSESESFSSNTLCKEGISDEELKKRLKERLKKQKEKSLQMGTVPECSEISENANFATSNSQETETNKSEQTNSVPTNGNKANFQEILAKFMNNSYVRNTHIKSLKNGICFLWISNNFTCQKSPCFYSHNANEIFKKKLMCYPSTVIMSFVPRMQNDILFVDLIMAAFKVLSERNQPEIWITFLIYLVFCITEPSDVRFIKFWANAARFFCQLSSEYAAANGFASLLSIFHEGDDSQKKKIVEFIKVIKQPPIQVSITCDLLEPVAQMDLPLPFLIEALDSFIKTQSFAQALKVYEIIPKIMEATITVKELELLIKFCMILKSMNEHERANKLKQELDEKIATMDIKVLVKKQITDSLAEIDAIASEDCFDNYFQEKRKSNYFKLEGYEDDLIKAIESSSVVLPNVKSLKELEIYPNSEKEENPRCDPVSNIKGYLNTGKFNLLATSLNELKGDIKQAAEEILKELFQKTISIKEIVKLVKIMLLKCKTESAALVIASIGITFIIHLVNIGKWDDAYIVLTLCSAKEINLINGRVFSMNGVMKITQCRITLFLAELYAYKENYADAVNLIKKHFLYSCNRSLYNLSWKEDDEKVRIRILEQLLKKIISNQLTEMAYDLFLSVWREQKRLDDPLDLRRFADDILTLLLNEGKDEAILIYDEIKAEIELKSCTIRALLITLVRRQQLEKAKSIPLAFNQSVYFLPDVTSSAAVMVVSSFWIEEEIFIMFNILFDLLIARKYKADGFSFGNSDDYGVRIQISYSEDSSFSTIMPLCLNLTNPLSSNIYERIQLVLRNHFIPPVQLNILSKAIILEKNSLKRHLDSRNIVT